MQSWGSPGQTGLFLDLLRVRQSGDDQILERCWVGTWECLEFWDVQIMWGLKP